MEVHRLEHVELEPPGASEFLRGVDERERERLAALLLVVELRHQHVAVVRDDGACRISVVDRFGGLARDERAEVVHRNRSLFADCRRSLRRGYSCSVAETYDIRMVEVDKRLLVRFHPCFGREFAFLPSKAGVPDEIGCRLRRCEVQDVVVFGECRSGFGIEEICALRRRVDAGQAATHRNGNFAFSVDFLETRSVVGNIIKLLAAGEILERAGFALSVLARELFREKADLLRCAAALVLRPCVGEDAAASRAGKFVHSGPCPARALPVIDRVGVAFAESLLGNALDERPVLLKARAEHEEVVGNLFAAFEGCGVVCGIDFDHGVLDPLDAGRDELFLFHPYIVGFPYTCADEREAGLVEMFVRGIDNRDVRLVELSSQACRHRNACRAAADYENLGGNVLGRDC